AEILLQQLLLAVDRAGLGLAGIEVAGRALVERLGPRPAGRRAEQAVERGTEGAERGLDPVAAGERHGPGHERQEQQRAVEPRDTAGLERGGGLTCPAAHRLATAKGWRKSDRRSGKACKIAAEAIN